jgi:hypothetical protein
LVTPKPLSTRARRLTRAWVWLNDHRCPSNTIRSLSGHMARLISRNSVVFTSASLDLPKLPALTGGLDYLCLKIRSGGALIADFRFFWQIVSTGRCFKKNVFMKTPKFQQYRSGGINDKLQNGNRL